MGKTTFAGLGLATGLLVLTGCAAAPGDPAAEWIVEMDSRPPEEQVPNWPEIRALMMREAPKVGDDAPDFELETRDGRGTIRLSEFQEARPVVLIFGSWT
ncbi:MAG: hypothetical protein ACYTGC_16370 [Planctomycetota bacterium]|jgi:hypothetical protein